jgi:hypothetical protein
MSQWKLAARGVDGGGVSLYFVVLFILFLVQVTVLM